MGAMARDAGQKADEVGRKADRSEGLDHAVRFGMVVYGVVHLVIAWLALQLAFGNSSGEASGTGAMRELAQQPFGAVVLWLVAIGMLLLVGWRLLDAVTAHRDDEGLTLWRKRATDVGQAVVFGVLSFSALRVVTGSSSGGGSSEDTMSAKVMQWPGGQWLVAAVGVGIIVVGLVLMFRGISEAFTDSVDIQGLTGKDGRTYVTLGKIGYVAKGIAIGLVGSLFVYAGVTHDPSSSGGMDEALKQVLEQPFGPYLLGAMALGIGCYGIFCFANARHLDR